MPASFSPCFLLLDKCFSLIAVSVEDFKAGLVKSGLCECSWVLAHGHANVVEDIGLVGRPQGELRVVSGRWLLLLAGEEEVAD